MHRRIFLFPFLLLLSGTVVYGQADTLTPGNYAFNLANCIQYGLQHQNDVVNARLDVRYSQEQIKEATARLFPHGEINANFVDNLKLATQLIPDFTGPDPNVKIPVQFGTRFASSATGQINQTIFNSDYFIGLKASRVYKDLAQRNYKRTEIDTRVAITKAYYSVLANQENIRLSRSNMEQLAKTLKDTKARYDVGVAERIDVDRIQVSYNNVVTDIENNIRLLVYSTQLLKFQMGMPQEARLELTETVQDFSVNSNYIEDTVNYRVEDRIEYGIQNTQIALNELNLRSKKMQYLPSLSGYINYGWNYFAGSFGDLYKHGYGASALGLSLSWPIFTGTERIHQIRELQITLDQSRNNLAYLSQQIKVEVANANTQYLNNKALYNTQKENMELTQGIYERIVLKFEQGVATSLDVTSAESELKNAQVQYVTALLNTLISKTDLDKAMGKIR
ncbi:Outer membrane protein TolC [Chitinophaga terrae (ex Kim and Jung 2007)]|uniref:Outer membrane protein TolC n=1 Tax=Chitinophaga terrae (ex Kim and Jung 2007) TaxID=408074 RepID=A0A1H4ALI8_9BACT|nr:TolC family protein [Chitinophaga terrae (ex Kim and Jung 2007)]MDQ0106636.1 outer membrane protein TolC [Chitinophaga terrae (ex Kim and Jung 2007)]SEA36829.1 Outer membrane protein TolC [Chitinophaga terrae (ex Kim and Jung 2007)]